MSIKKILTFGLLIVVLEILGGYYYLKNNQTQKQITQASKTPSATTKTLPTQTPTVSQNAQLILDTQSNNIKRDDNFSVNVILDTFSNPTTASDLTIKFDPQYLTSNKTNEPFSPSKIFQKTVFNKIDTKTGVATMSAIAEIDHPFAGRGILTTISFHAIRSGDTQIRIDFVPKETRDSNIVSDTQDILESVQNLPITIK